MPARISPVADLSLSVTIAPAEIDAINVPNNLDLSVSANPSEYIIYIKT
ncbi:hypothetical protein ACLD43_18800 [Clostridium botulinum]